MNVRLRVALICSALAVVAGLVLLLVRPSLDPARIRPLVLVATAWVAFIAAAWLLRRVPVRTAIALIFLGGTAIQVAALSSPPQGSTDAYRYVWDGKVQAAGFDPYEYVPASAHLADLRNSFLFPSHPSQAVRYAEDIHCVSASYVKRVPAWDLAAGCTRLNRPTVPTIYPPVAEAYFLGVHFLPGGSTSTLPLQAAAAGFALATSGVLVFGLRRMRRDVRMACLWSWCPTVALEAGNNAHVDIVAVFACAAALLVLASARTEARTVLGGVLLGLAVATKVTPVLAVPAVLRRRWLTVLASAGSAVVVVYTPHLFAVGRKVVGYLPGYLQEEGYSSGSRFGIIGLVFSGKAATVVAVLILAAVGLLVLRFSDPSRPWRGALVMTGAALAVATPHYQWYALLLVMLVALDGEPEWLTFAAGAYYAAEPQLGRYSLPWKYHDAVAYGLPVLVVLGGWLVRRSAAWLPALVPAAVPVTVPAVRIDAGPNPVAVAAPVPGAVLTGQPEPVLSAVLAAEEAAISAPALRTILDEPTTTSLPRRIPV
jgi:Glycosyltransferase family 87